jgi:hypothetical protein
MNTLSGFTKEDIKDLIKRFFVRHRSKFLVVLWMLFWGLVVLIGIYRSAGNYKRSDLSKTVAVTMECSGSENGDYEGYAIYLDDGQPTMGLTRNGEIYKTFPIEREEYDSIMNIDYRFYAVNKVSVNNYYNLPADDDMTAYYKVTVNDNKGKEIHINSYIYPLVRKWGSLRSKYVGDFKV